MKRIVSLILALTTVFAFAQTNDEALQQQLEDMENINLSNMMELSESLSKAKVSASYVFDTQISIEIKQSTQQTRINLFFGNDIVMNHTDAAPGVKIIYDYNNNTLVTLNDDDKTVMGIPLDFMADVTSMVEEQYTTAKGNDKPTQFKKTGKSKTILGYKADEYIAENESVTIVFWFSNEVPVDNSRMLRGLKKTGTVFAFDFAVLHDDQYSDGLVMELYATEKQHNTTTQLKMVKIEPKQNVVVNTSAYKKIEINH